VPSERGAQGAAEAILYYVEHFRQARRLKQIAIQKFLKDG